MHVVMFDMSVGVTEVNLSDLCMSWPDHINIMCAMFLQQKAGLLRQSSQDFNVHEPTCNVEKVSVP